VASLVTQALGASLVVIGFGLIAPFAGFLAAGALLITFGIAMERAGR
jgi:hypothetical protein